MQELLFADPTTRPAIDDDIRENRERLGVLTALFARAGQDSAQVARAVGLSVSRATAHLEMLEVLGLVDSLSTPGSTQGSTVQPRAPRWAPAARLQGVVAR